MDGKMKKAVQKFLRLDRVDPEKGVQRVEQAQAVEEFVQQIKAEFDRRKEERRPFELQWRLNQNFIAGNQYCDILAETGEVADYPATFEWEMRSVYNQIAPIVEAREAKLVRVQPGLVVRPATGDTEDIMSAKMSTRILKSAFAAHNADNLCRIATTWAETCGGVFYKSVWNPRSGFALGSMNGDVVYEGDISVTVVPYYEMYPSNNYAESLDDCDSVIHAKVFSADEIRSLWAIDVEGRSMNVFSMEMSGMVSGGVGYNPSLMQVRDNILDDAELVLEYFEKPSNDFPDGRYAVIVGDICAHLCALPYRCGERYCRGYPFSHQKCLTTPGILWGTSVVDRCIPIQRDYNAVKNRINEYIARMTIGNLVVEKGSLVDESILDTGIPPGSVIEYNPGATPPQWMSPQEIPATLLNQVDALQDEFVRISGVSDYAKSGQTAPAISSGTALEALAEQDDSRLTLTAENIRSAFREMGKQWLRLFKQFAVVPRLTRLAGKNDGDVCAIVWKGSDITSDDVIVDTDNEMTNTPAQRKQLALELLQTGMFADPDTGRMTRETRAKLMEVFQLGNWESAIDTDEMHAARAQREALSFSDGKMPQVMELDNHAAHIAEHTRYALGAEFRRMQERNPDLARLWLEHINAHKEISVRRSMQLAGAGSDGGGQVTGLAQSGRSPEEAVQVAAIQNGSMGGRPKK